MDIGRQVGARRLLPLFCAGILLLASAPVGAQPYDGNIVNGQDLQPTPAEVLPREQRAGVVAGAAQRARNGRTVRRLGRKLLREERNHPPTQDGVPQPLPP